MKILQTIFRQKELGLKKLTKDIKDFSYDFLFGYEYTPKHTRKLLKTLSVKTQSYNTCGWNSSATAKEIDEDRSVVAHIALTGL